MSTATSETETKPAFHPLHLQLKVGNVNFLVQNRLLSPVVELHLSELQIGISIEVRLESLTLHRTSSNFGYEYR